MLNEALPAGWSPPVNSGAVKKPGDNDVTPDGSTSSSKFFAEDGCYRTVAAAPGQKLAPLCAAVDAEYVSREAAKVARSDLRSRVDAAKENVRRKVLAGVGVSSSDPDYAFVELHNDSSVKELVAEFEQERVGRPKAGPTLKTLP